MLKEAFDKKEKKVEYVELIYDLIFVYIIGRNNTLLHATENGFVEAGMFMAYIMCTLAVIQIWTFTTYYINLYGRNSPRDYIFMFINMFLMYFIGEGTQKDWQGYHTQYQIAWALILINIGIQYLIELKNRKAEPVHVSRIKRMAIILFCEAGIVLLSIPEFNRLGTSYFSLLGILFGICSVSVSSRSTCSGLIDFSHLSERIMLYVVFTFGEMIIAIASYFDGELSFGSIYFCLMAFLIVVGLFLSYGTVYDHIIDRDKNTHGIGYILIHLFIIFFLNNITGALEFMREEEIRLIPKILFLIASVIMYYVFLFLTGIYAKQKCRVNKSFYLIMVLIALSFAGIMVLFRENMYINIAVTVIYVFAVFGILYSFAKKVESK